MRNFSCVLNSRTISAAAAGLMLLALFVPMRGTDLGQPSYNLVQDEGVSLARRHTLNFTGKGVTVTDAGGVTVVDIPEGGSGGTCDVLLGDVTGTCNANTVAKVNGVGYPSAPSTHQIPIITAANTATYKTLPQCNGSLDALNFDQVTDNPSCRTFAAALHSVTFSFTGGGAAIATGACNQFPTAAFAGTIVRIDVSGQPSGSFTADIWKAAGAIPTGANKISASAPATLSSSQLNQNGSLTGWTTSVSVGDVFGCTVATSTTVENVTVQIWIQ